MVGQKWNIGIAEQDTVVDSFSNKSLERFIIYPFTCSAKCLHR